MSTITRCDGCQRDLRDIDDHVTVERVEPLGNSYVTGLPRPGELFHWCRACALVAVAAIAGRDA